MSTIFLTTSNISFSFDPDKGATPKTWWTDPQGMRHPRYSTGELEKALSEGKRVVVLSSRYKLGEHDDWWLSMVRMQDVHLMPKDIAGDGTNFTLFCKDIVERVYDRLWPENVFSEWENGQPMFWTQALSIINKQEKA